MAGELLPGTILGNRYEIIEKVGEGGMAIVYKAKCKLLNRFVGIKVLKDEFKEDVEFLSKFNIESQAAASLSHQNIVSVYDVGVEGDVNYIVMEYVEGITLKQYISKKGALGWQEAVAFSIQIASALEHAHKNRIIHRDIKPQNIILTAEGVLKVTDFGIAHATTASTVRVGGALGSVHYSSPEQARGTYTDEKTDIYSLGVVMYEMLTGKVPFQGDTAVAVALMHMEKQPTPISVLSPNVPKYVEAIVNKAMAKETANRFENATLLLNALRQALRNPNGAVASGVAAAGVSNVEKRVPPAMQNYPSKPTEPSNKYSDDDYDDDDYDEDDDDDDYRKKKKMPKKKKKGMNKQDKIAIWASIITVLVVLTVGTVFAWPWLAPMIGIEVSSDKEVKLPNIVGKNKDEAKAEIEKLGLKFEIDIEEVSKEYEKDKITYQSPEADMKVKAKSVVKVRVSLGQESIKVPSLVNKDQVVAISMLEKMGLKAKIEQEESDTLAAGIVVRQFPTAESDIETGGEVTIYVNTRTSDEITMVSLRGLTLEKATSKLEDLGLVLGDVSRDYSDLPVDTVISQSIASNAQVLKKNKVDLVLSRGPKEKPSESPSESPSATPGQKPSESPSTTPSTKPTPSESPKPQKTTKTLVINVPQGTDSTTIKVVANGKTIYEENVSKDKGSVGINVTGTGTATVEVYFNNEYQLTKVIDFSKD